MKIKVESDVFDIVERIKEIDEGYFILYDLKKCKFELHNNNQSSTYCLSFDCNNLGVWVIDKILQTNVRNIDKIVEEIDKSNKEIETNLNNKVYLQSDYMLREIYDFCSNSSKCFDGNSFNTLWV